MKLFGRSGGYWLFWTGFIYFVASIAHLTWFKDDIRQEYITLAWLLLMAMPLFVPQLREYLNMAPFFDRTDMWRKREIGDKVSKDIEDTNTSNVLKFPEVQVPRLKAVEPELDVSRPPYALGVNDSGNVQFTMRNDYGTTSLTMTDEGVVNLIEDLAHYIRRDYKVEITKK